jgi:hypothetical protein
MKLSKTLPLIALCAMACVPMAAQAGTTIKAGYEFKKPKLVVDPNDISYDQNGTALPSFGGPSNGFAAVTLSFEGISQYDAARFNRNFIPPDTMGAIGTTQYLQSTNGAYAVWDKATGVNLSMVSDVAWWATAGQTGTGGDARVMFNSQANRWIAVAFGANAKDLQIAVSDTDNALGGWKSTKFEGYAGFGFGAVADYPTLAFDNNAVYIGTNNFAPKTAGGSNSFRGTTLNVIPIASLFNAATPTTAGIVQFTTPFDSASSSNDFSRGFAIQGVNSKEASTTGNIFTVNIADFNVQRYDVLNAGTAGATRTATTEMGSTYDFNSLARQPIGYRAIDPLDDRISSSVYEVNGRIYGVQTITPVGGDETRVRYYVIDSVTNALLDEGEIGAVGFDFYQGSLAVNDAGHVVIAYNRSGFDAAEGKIRIYARSFYTDAAGKLVQLGNELMLKESLTDQYHNGSAFGGLPAGRQRWGDYSAVSLDPNNQNSFWVIGQFAREFNSPQFGHPGGTGGSRWGTWITQLSIVPEPQTWAMMVFGFGLIGYGMRSRRASVSFA